MHVIPLSCKQCSKQYACRSCSCVMKVSILCSRCSILLCVTGFHAVMLRAGCCRLEDPCKGLGLLKFTVYSADDTLKYLCESGFHLPSLVHQALWMLTRGRSTRRKPVACQAETSSTSKKLPPGRNNQSYKLYAFSEERTSALGQTQYFDSQHRYSIGKDQCS